MRHYYGELGDKQSRASWGPHTDNHECQVAKPATEQSFSNHLTGSHLQAEKKYEERRLCGFFPKCRWMFAKAELLEGITTRVLSNS
jgi:hypothetical protein